LKSKFKLNKENYYPFVILKEILSEKPRNGLYKSEEFHGKGNRWIKMKSIFANRILSDQKMERILVTDDEEKKFSCSNGDLIFGRTSLVFDGVGKCCIINNINDRPIFESNTFLVRLDQSKCDPRFYFYYFNSPYGRSNIYGIIRQTAASQITSDDLIELSVPYPILRLQKRISDICWTLDKMILSLENQNIYLEKIIQTIFKSWFVDFDGQTEFVDSELGQIPKGWRVGKLSELCSTQYGYTASAIDHDTGTKYLRITDMNKNPWICWNDVPYCEIDDTSVPKYRLEKGDLLVSRMADPGKVGIIETDTDAVFASYLVRLKPRSIEMSYFLFYFLRSQFYVDYALGSQGGSVQKNMNAKIIVDIEMIIPDQFIINSFYEYIYPLRIMILNNLEEQNTLSRIRDSLIPKLISGKIRV